MRTNYSIGHHAEQVAADYLRGLHYKIIETNWKTRLCEIDIVAQKNGAMYFIEVKYRSTSKQGQGLDYITPSKLKKMQFAAEVWVTQNNWQAEYQLAAIEITGPDYTVSKFVIDM